MSSKRKFTSIQAMGSREEGFRMFATSDDGIAWTSEVQQVDHFGQPCFEPTKWTQVKPLPDNEHQPFGVLPRK